MRGTPRRESFILYLDDFGREITVSCIPPVSINAQSLHVNSALIQFLNTIRTEGAPATPRVARERRILHYFADCGDGGVRVDVDYFDALSRHAHLATCWWSRSLWRLRLRLRESEAIHQAMTGQHARRRADHGLNEISA